MAKVDVKCPFCKQTDPVKKHGQGSAGHQRYRCQACCRSFQLEYKYRACQHQIIDLAMNNAGIRDTARALHISINAVKNSRRKTSPLFHWIICTFSAFAKWMKCGHLSAIKRSNAGCGTHGSTV